MLEQAEGTFHKIAGRVQDAVGGAAGDRALQLEGKARQAAGSVEQAAGEALDLLRDSASKNPLLVTALVAGAAFLIGTALARR
ncbi:CsbD family protein [Pseudorhodoferax sp. LjRoot39]|uniref:CsbD family protein n=1 Tax=Pseudorhodoferax sp. LjRoot39 TaxID=3342328 RepID=UPI003ECE3DDE